ncbi:hypothetical protein [Rathayibacter sp. VKM Ac-2805]|uniref:phage adaptor protein n=1 Tax=Rathayibacter sp. VKM Ac-2805 TaxID=2609258 RepID=UPI0013203008|nr:hypothetical protein [Rathayibacter sp. VKM Ac-2805]QHC73781.1 hypothetical protein GSU40_08890 [Rathayibacter sp. VKM Ac-2805]
MADYNVSSLIDKVIARAKDTSFSRDLVRGYLQDTQDEVLNRHRFPFTEARLVETLYADSTTFAYDSGHQEILQLVLSSADQAASLSHPQFIEPTEFFERNPVPDTNPAGRPSTYTDYGGELYWDRPLDTDYTIWLRYRVAAPRLSDDSAPLIPEEFSNLLVEGGLAGVERYRENFDVAALHDRRVEDLAEDMLQRYGLRQLRVGKSSLRGRRG